MPTSGHRVDQCPKKKSRQSGLTPNMGHNEGHFLRKGLMHLPWTNLSNLWAHPTLWGHKKGGTFATPWPSSPAKWRNFRQQSGLSCQGHSSSQMSAFKCCEFWTCQCCGQTILLHNSNLRGQKQPQLSMSMLLVPGRATSPFRAVSKFWAAILWTSWGQENAIIV